ncbi:MAG: class I SAM-dependent methyltransferase [Chloroflexi bacterium]|nr:class I SAM-dependent methyltransferase [Chloroflexota bacterium]
MCRHRHADDPERRKWQDPEAILADIGLKAGDTFVDLGCGGGFFTLPAARIVGKGGKVYGVDIDAALVSELADLARREGLDNLELTVARAEGAVLCESCADIVFLGIVLHDFDDPVKVLKNARRMLKANGRLINLDWKKLPMPIGPPLQKRFSEEKAMELIKAAGFSKVAVRDSGPNHYMVVASPQAAS